MKGKVSFYFNAPNTAKVRSRIEVPSESFTQKLRSAICESIIEVVNENTLAIRAKLAKKFADMKEPVKAEAVDQLGNVLNSFFDVVAQATPFTETEKPAKEASADADTAEGPAEGDSAKDDGFED